MKRIVRQWVENDEAVAAIEAGFLFPVLLSIFMGIVDIGMALNVNMKVVNAAHVMADLLAREDNVTDALMTDAVVAGQLVVAPYSRDTMGHDVVGIQFTGVTLTPTERWRETFNMDPNDDVFEGSEGLGDEDEGVIAVTVRYTYMPYFTNFVVGNIQMEEISYARGRSGGFVTRSAA